RDVIGGEILCLRRLRLFTFERATIPIVRGRSPTLLVRVARMRAKRRQNPTRLMRSKNFSVRGHCANTRGSARWMVFDKNTPDSRPLFFGRILNATRPRH